MTPGTSRAPGIAVILVRSGQLPAGAEETLAEAGGRGIVIGEDAEGQRVGAAL